MIRTTSEGIAISAASRSFLPHRGRWLAGAFVVGMAVAAPAHAQWIGTPGGGATATAPSAIPPAEMAPVAPAAPLATPAPISVAPGGMSSEPMPSGGFSPGAMSPGMSMPAQPDAAAMATMQDCQSGVDGLRNDIEKRGAALQAASKKKLPPSELCPMFRTFVTAQQKFYGYLDTNKTKCRVPEEVLKKVKTNVGSIASVRDRVCKAAQLQESGGGGGGGGPPQQGAVASGLGLPSGLPSIGAATQKGGVYDTLGGSALR